MEKINLNKTKFFVGNPTFSAFRSGEPIAYDYALKALSIENKSHFKKTIDGVVVIGKGDIIEVYLYENDEPFKFTCEVI